MEVCTEIRGQLGQLKSGLYRVTFEEQPYNGHYNPPV